ncbi:unnamed protein product [Amoebophrya sp. A120]|nr:unnamed protein product [Amoebophrya sp. A120]|eukprot:GSA120T00007615001.1
MGESVKLAGEQQLRNCARILREIFVVDEMAIKALVGGMCSFATLLLEAALFLIREHKEEKKRGKLEKQATFHYSHTLRGGTGTRNRIVPTETSDEQEQGLTKTPARAPAAREDSVSRGSSRAKGGRDETTGDDRDSREDVRDNEQAEVATASANSSKQGEMGENWVGEVDELDTPKNFTIRQRRS